MQNGGDAAAAVAATKRYVAAVDIGSTNVRCVIYDRAGRTRLRVCSVAMLPVCVCAHAGTLFQMPITTPEAFSSEIDPDAVWSCFIRVVGDAIKSKPDTCAHTHLHRTTVAA
jgi:sugar (pentulose or hexulose) kinase